MSNTMKLRSRMFRWDDCVPVHSHAMPIALRCATSGIVITDGYVLIDQGERVPILRGSPPIV